MGLSKVAWCGFVLAAFAAGAALADDRPALTGTWSLDRRASDDPQRVLFRAPDAAP